MFFQIVSLKIRLFFINTFKDAQHFVNIIGSKKFDEYQKQVTKEKQA